MGAPWNSTETRVLELMGSGSVNAEQAAAHLGVSPSLISQLISQEDFSEELQRRKFESLQKHNLRDLAYDDLEGSVLEQLKGAVSMVFRPMELARILTVLNSAKRRGQSSPEQIHETKTVVHLTMPTQIINKFSVNGLNQVVAAGAQELVTASSGQVLKRLESMKEEKSAEQQTVIQNRVKTLLDTQMEKEKEKNHVQESRISSA